MSDIPERSIIVDEVLDIIAPVDQEARRDESEALDRTMRELSEEARRAHTLFYLGGQYA